MKSTLRRAAIAAAFMLAASPALAQHRSAPRFADERSDGAFDPAADYREGPQYAPRTLAPAERVHRGHDGAYYCRRPDGTTGLVTGAIDGFLLGDAIRRGHSRTVATLVTGHSATLEGQIYDRLNHEIHCR